jgi:hypothetical protein
MSNNALRLAVCLVVVAIIALAAESYPHAFPRKGVVKLFDNERVTAWEVNWLKGVEQPVHRPGTIPAWPRMGAKDVLDSNRVVEWDYTWKAGVAEPTHVHDKDSVEIFVDGGAIRTKFADGREETKTIAFKDARFVPRGQTDSEEAVSGAPRAIVIELR